MRLTQLAQVMPTTGRVSSSAAAEGVWISVAIGIQDTTGEYVRRMLGRLVGRRSFDGEWMPLPRESVNGKPGSHEIRESGRAHVLQTPVA